jgi:hypothetical protein
VKRGHKTTSFAGSPLRYVPVTSNENALQHEIRMLSKYGLQQVRERGVSAFDSRPAVSPGMVM